ncbi:MAG: hypothetical protein ACP5OG_02985 [Candidatus Nanoarchaeia archaeon]
MLNKGQSTLSIEGIISAVLTGRTTPTKQKKGWYDFVKDQQEQRKKEVLGVCPNPGCRAKNTGLHDFCHCGADLRISHQEVKINQLADEELDTICCGNC